ncbi:PD-(D/E)XK nuclease family protein [Streptomyces sp. NPDC093591]|uniref:PD-(D/E)XK nuclease family protein n=1 Tax=Streptomyces sp. NPDC093591 TaxID=3366044 RepID=UPI00382DDD57
MSVLWTRYGAPAFDALRTVVAEVKRGDPLAPVTILVPTELSGLVARRALARGVGNLPGVAGLSMLTVDRLAERLGAPTLAGSGRCPATGPVLAGAWRHALEEEAGLFAHVAKHPATIRTLVEVHRELREVDETGLDLIARSGEPIVADLVRLHRRVATLLSTHWYDVADLRRGAANALRAQPERAREIGATVLFLPQDLPLGTAALLEAFAASGLLQVVAAATGDERADQGVMRSLQRLHVVLSDVPQGGSPTASRILHASDADDEVRCVVRMLTTELRYVPAHRITVLYGRADPYARLLAEHLAAAEIVSHGAGVRPTIERTLARMLIDALALPDHDWRRDEVLAVLASAPVRDTDGSRVPAARWDRISRDAGVVAGAEWDRHLEAYAEQEHTAAEAERASEAPHEGLIARYEHNAKAAEALRAFVSSLRARLDQGAGLRSWSELAAWGGGVFRALAGDVEAERWLPEDETHAAQKIQQILDGLANLETLEITADLTALRQAIELELGDDLPRRGRFGKGVLVAPLSYAIGLESDAVFVVGMAEDLVPGPLGEDALLPERIRALTDGQLPPLRDRLDRQHRHLLAAFAAAPQCAVSFPRGDLLHSSPHLPSRWLLPSLRRLSGDNKLQATQWESVKGPWLVASPSYAASLALTDELATEQEWRTRAALAHHTSGGTVDDALPRDKVVRRALAMLRTRTSSSLTRFDGDLSGHGVPDPSAVGVVVSPTALEAWAVCPHAYFLEQLLGIEPIESPEELIQISPREIGNLVHTALDRFFTQQAHAGAAPGGATPWTAQQHAELRHIALEVATESKARGVTGHHLLWQQEQARILDDLDRLLDDDDRLRRETGRQQARSELIFGMRGVAPVGVTLPDGRVICFRGSADRIDRVGDEVVVVDYKTGSPEKFKDLCEANPTSDGTKLQLPVYAYAARSAMGMPQGAVSAEYWFLRKERGQRRAVPLTPEVHRRYSEALAVITDGIANGLFPHRPPTGGSVSGFTECQYCDPDGLGVKELRDRWQRKRHDPRLAAYLALVEPEAAKQ